MPKVQVIGIEASSGAFKPAGSDQTINYNNVKLYYLDPEDQTNLIAGHKTGVFKFKTERFNELNKVKAGDLVNHIVDIGFNQWGQPEKIEIVK